MTFVTTSFTTPRHRLAFAMVLALSMAFLVSACGQGDVQSPALNGSGGTAPTGATATGTTGTNVVAGCAAGQTDCSGTCVLLDQNAANCGACFNACAPGSACVGGSCACQAGLTDCGGTCVDTQNDVANCGVCGQACTTGQVCTAGACTCQGGLTDCGTGCIDTNSTAANCGGCNNACPANQVCSQGTCAASCAAGLTQCGQDCVDLTTSAANCSACGMACSAGQECSGGSCGCTSGQELCGGQCVATDSDLQNCGTCGTVCSGGQVCSGGSCACSTAGDTYCPGAGSCVTLANDPSNCGSCDNVCASGVCDAGQCTTVGTDAGSGGSGGTNTTTGATTDSGSGGAGGTGGTTTDSGSGGTAGTTTSGGGSGGSAGTGGTGNTGECDPGTSQTQWASSCPTSAPSCTQGTWVAGGPDPDHQNFSLKAESTHFAVYSDENISTSTAQSATQYLEDTVWPTYFGSPIYFKEPLCDQSTKYKASIHVHSDWGLTGGAWSSTRMGMWIGTGALSDHWGLGHEFMHAVQSVSGGQSCNQSNTCGWVYESHANFMPHQLAEYRSNVHCSELMVNSPHMYLGSTRDRYCNWQFMEYLKDKYCYSAVNAIWTGSPTPDPFTGIMNGQGWNIGQLNDFIGDWAMHNITWDYQNPPPTSGGNQGSTYRSNYGSITDTSKTERRLRLTKVEPLDNNYASNRRFISPFYWAPQRFGYNVIRLYPDSGATQVTVTFRGVTQSSPNSDWRWGLVATDAAITTSRYSPLQSGSDGQLTFCVNSGEPLFLVIAATPSQMQNIVWDQAYNTIPRYPYMIELQGAWPDGFQNGTQDACPSGLTRASNGGGCAPSGTSAYVGPYATVLSGATVSGSARIEDHATVARGTVSGGTVGALSLIGSNNTAFNISSGTAMTTFYPLGFFEGSQGLSGGTLVGDVEYRGSGLSRSSGTCTGFVDASTCLSPGTDNTPAPPYTWRN